MTVVESELPDPLIAGTAICAVVWAAAAVAAFVMSIRLSRVRRTIWPLALLPQAILALWWSWLNTLRWLHDDFTPLDYRQAVNPLVPVLFIVLAVDAFVWISRARRTDAIEITLERALPDSER